MPNRTWTIRRCLDWTRDYLRDKGDERPRLAAEWLLSQVTGLSRTELYMNFDKPMAADELAVMHEGVLRRAKGEPLQYIVGETGFRTISLMCEPGVLIPRPETEVLVEQVLDFIDGEVLHKDGGVARDRAELPWNAEVAAALDAERAAREAGGTVSAAEHALTEDDLESPLADLVPAALQVAKAGEAALGMQDAPADQEGALDKAGSDAQEARPAAAADVDPDPPRAEAGDIPRMARVLEVGCGTGCISLSIASERRGHVHCVAIDIEPRAVDLSIRNRAALGLSPGEVDVRLGNLVSPLDRETEWGTFDVLVSNPPYIPSAVMASLPHEVADYEPALALDGGVDGLDIFRRLVNAAPHMLRSGGLLACELYEGHLEQAAALCRVAHMADIRIVEDLADRPRVVLARV